jgi:hypothetical protein
MSTVMLDPGGKADTGIVEHDVQPSVAAIAASTTCDEFCSDVTSFTTEPPLNAAVNVGIKVARRLGSTVDVKGDEIQHQKLSPGFK